MKSVVSAIAVAAALNGLHGDWLDDDPIAITNNPDVQCPRGIQQFWENVADVLSNDFWGTPMASEQSHLSFRPLTILSFRLQHCLVGFHAVSFHAVNTILHAIVCFQLHSFIAAPLLPRRAQRSFAASLFAVHAVHVEVVTNTVGRAELLSAILFFTSLRVYRPLASSVHHSALSSVLRIASAIAIAGGAMLCKEVGLTALLLCAALDCAIGLRRIVVSGSPAAIVPLACRLLLLAAGSMALLSLRLSLNNWRAPQFSSGDNSAAFCETAHCRLLSYSYVYWLNLSIYLQTSNQYNDSFRQPALLLSISECTRTLPILSHARAAADPN